MLRNDEQLPAQVLQQVLPAAPQEEDDPGAQEEEYEERLLAAVQVGLRPLQKQLFRQENPQLGPDEQQGPAVRVHGGAQESHGPVQNPVPLQEVDQQRQEQSPQLAGTPLSNWPKAGNFSSLGSNVHSSIEELRYVSLYICYLLYQKSNGNRLDLHYLHLDEAQQIVEIVLQEAQVRRKSV